MAVFVSGSDETSGKDHRGVFHHAGFIAPEKDWSDYFAPAWRERVLDGIPSIPYLHMTDIRSDKWRKKYGLSRLEAEGRVDEAIRVIDGMGSLYAIGSRADAGFFLDMFAGDDGKILTNKGAIKKFVPDHLCFMGYVFVVLNYVNYTHPEAEKVDFIVEHKHGVFDEVNEFYDGMAGILTELGSPELVDLLGELIPGHKDRVPLQAADVLCWHSQRAQAGIIAGNDAARYWKLAHRGGFRHEWTEKEIIQLSRNLMEKKKNEFKEFDDTMGKLLKVPHSEIKAKLDAEKAAKKRKTKRSSASGRASGDKG
jgi:hypothetical protein